MSRPDPIQAKYREGMNALAGNLDELFNGKTEPKKVAFVLLIAEFGAIEGGRVNYISNGERSDITAMLKEYLARHEGRLQEGGSA